MAGRIGGKYELRRRIGEGTFGEVWLGIDDAGRNVVLKRLHPHWLADRATRAAFLNEARLLKAIPHAHVVEVLDVVEEAAQVFIVMEYAPGGNLADHLRHRGRLPVDEAVRIADGMLAGLQAAHASGVVHRDVKPSNVLLGAAAEPKLADFGLAKLVGSRSGLSVTGTQPGTLGYMSPEQAEGRGDLDARSDIYAVAVILFEMLAGVAYLDLGGRSEFGAREAILKETPDFSRVPGGKPLVAVLRKALAKDRRDRYASAQEMRDALGGAAKRSIGVIARPRRAWVAPAVGAAVVLLAVTVLLAGALPEDGGPRTAGVPADDGPPVDGLQVGDATEGGSESAQNESPTEEPSPEGPPPSGDGGSAASNVSSPEEPDGPPRTETRDWTFTINENRPDVAASPTDNCRDFPGPLRIISGRITATWDEDLSGGPQLQMKFRLPNGSVALDSGPSPLEITVPPGLVPEGEGALFVVHVMEGHVATLKSVAVRVVLEHTGTWPADGSGRHSCTFGS